MTVSSLPHRPRAAAVLATLTTTLLAAGLLSVAPAARADETPAPAAPTTPAGRYVPVAPTRVLDTRLANRPVANNETRIVDLSSAFTASATAVVMNLTVVTPTGPGYLTAFPAGATRPTASSVNFSAGQTRANSVTVAVGSGNDISVYALVTGASGRAHVVVDVLGYYGVAGSTEAGSSYEPLAAPVRLFDTRRSIGALTNTYPKNTGIVTLDYGSPTVNRTISAAVMNITVTGTTGGGNLTIWNGLGAIPVVSTLNWARGDTAANMAVVPVVCTDPTCTSLTFSIRNNFSPSTQVIGDIAGVYATPSAGGLLYRPTTPTRVTDTRLKAPYTALNTGGWGVTDINAISSTARAVNINLTVVRPALPTYLTAYPTGGAKPGVSSVNSARGDIVANAVQVRTARGQFTTANYAGHVDIVIDLQGTFELDPAFVSGGSAATSTSAPAGAGSAVRGSVAGA